MPDDFLESLMEHMASAIENPGTPCASETFVISKPEGMSDEQWSAWIADIRLVPVPPTIPYPDAP